MDLSNLQPIDPPKGDIKSKLSGLTPIGNVGEEKKNQETETPIPISTPTQGQVPTTQPVQQSKPTNNMGGGSNTTANTRTDNQVTREQLQDQFDFAVFDVVEKSKYNDPNKWSASKTFGTPSEKKKEYEETQARIAEGKTVNIPTRTEADKQKEIEKLQAEGFVADEKTGGMVDTKEVEAQTESNVNLVTNRDIIGITTGQENPYYLGSTKATEYDAAQFNYQQSKKASKEFQTQTGLSDLDFLEWTAYSDKELQDFLANNPNATPEQLDYFYDNTWQKFDMTKKIDMQDTGNEMASPALLLAGPIGTAIFAERFINKNAVDYIVNGIMSNTLMGRGATFLYSVFEYAGLDQTTARIEGDTETSKSVGELYREKQQGYAWNMSRYKNLSGLQKTLEGAIYLGIDMPLFELGTTASAGVTNKLWNFGKNILKGTPKSVILNTVANVGKEAFTMGGGLGTYDALLTGSEKLTYKTPEELELQDYKDVINSYGNGVGTGIIVGSVMGIGNRILSRANSKALATTYSPDPTTGMVKISPSTGVAVKALNYAGQTALFGTEAIVFSASHELFEEGTLSNYTTEEMWQGIVSFIPIKAMGVNKLIESVKGVRVNPDFLKDQAKGKNWMDRVEFNSVEMGLLGIKDVSELKNYSEKQNESWYNAALKNEKIPEATKRKLAYGIQGLEIAKTFNVTDRVIVEIDGKPAVISYDKNGKLADISVFNSKVEANREVLQTQDVIENNKLTEKTTNLAPESVDNINMFYEKNPDRLVALNDAISKVSNKRSLAEKEAVKEFNDLIDKELKTQEQNPINKMAEEIKIEPPKEETKPVEVKEEKIILNDKEYTVRENEVFVKNEQGLLTRETNNDIIKQVKEQYDTQNKSGLPSEVREGQKPIETEPVKETSGEKIEAGRDVQTPEKEVGNKTQLFAAKGDKIESVSEKVMFTKAEVDIKVIREKTKAVNEVAKTHQEFARGIAKIAREAKNKGEISSAKYNTLINKIGQSIKDSRKTVDGEKVTVTAEQKRKEVVEWLETALANSAEAKYRSETKKSQRKAKKLFTIDKNPFGGKLNEVKEAANTDITLLNAEQLVAFREGLESIVKAGDRVTPKEINDFVNSVKEMGIEKIDKNPSEYISTILSQEIKTTADYDKAVREFRKALITADKMYREGKLTEAEFVEIVESLTKGENSIDVKIKIGGAEIKKEYLDGISEQTKEYNKKRQEGKDFGLSKPETELFDKTVILASNKEVQAKMSIKDAELLDYALRNANEGFTNQFSLRAFDRLKTIYKENKMEAPLNEVISGKYFEKRSDREAKTWQEILDTVQWFRIDQLFKKAGRKVYDAIFFDSSSAVGNRKAFESKMLTDHAKVRDKYFAEVKRNAIFRGAIDMISPKKAVREADVYGQIIRTELNHQSKIKSGEIPADMPSYFEAVMARKIPIGNVTRSQNYKDLMDVWGKIKSDPKFFKENGEFNIDYAKGKLSKKGLAYYDSFNKVFTELEPYIKMETEMSGRVFVPEVNYDGYHAIIERTKAGNTKDIDIDTYISQVNNPIKHTGSIYERRNIVELIRTDGSRLLIEQVRNIGDNIYIKPEYKSTHDALKNYAKRNPESGNLINATQQSIARRVIMQSHGEQMGNFAKTTSFVVGKTTKLVLGVFTRIPQEGLVNVARNLGSVGTNPKEFFKKENPVYKEMLDGLMSDKNFMSSMGEYLERGGKSLGTKAIEGIIIAMDAYVVPRTFKTAFDKEYKKQTGKEFDTKAYESDYMYRFKNSEAIRQAKIEGLSRVQELFNTKTSIENPPDIRLFGRNYKKTSSFAQLTYMLQSFGANEKAQMGKAFLNIKEGIKTGDADMRNTGIRDALTIPLTNFLYLQAGLLSSSVMRQLYDDEFWKTGDFSGLQDGWNEYQDKYLNPASQAKSFVASLGTLVTGKYGNFVPLIAGTIYAFIDADKDIPADTKSILAEISKGAHIKPVSLSSKSYGSIGGALAGLHPVSKELVNLFDMVEQAAMVANIGSYSGDDKLDKDDEALADFILNFIRYAYPNPISNQIKRMQGKTKREIKDSTKTDSKITTDGTKTTDSKIALPDTKPLKQ